MLINLLMQGKGGVGKSYVAMLLAQHYYERAHRLRCFDTDPVNRTFAGYKAFDVEVVRLGERADEINPRSFDTLIERLLDDEEADTVVIDNGAATFLPLLGYVGEVGALQLLQAKGDTVRIHSVITGGQALEDTLQGFAEVLRLVPDLPVVVWLNEYFGPVEVAGDDSTPLSFEDLAVFRRHAERVHAVVRLPAVRRETFGHDIEAMLRRRLSYGEGEICEAFTIMARQRLRQTWRALDAAMARANL